MKKINANLFSGVVVTLAGAAIIFAGGYQYFTAGVDLGRSTWATIQIICGFFVLLVGLLAGGVGLQKKDR